jgi:hypothetical protein
MRPGSGVRAATTGICHAQTPPATVGAGRCPVATKGFGLAAGAPAEGDRIDGKWVPGPVGGLAWRNR